MSPGFKPRRSSRPRPSQPRIAQVLAGGGPLGAIYEIGALCALADCLTGLGLNACEHDVGVPAGGFIAAGLANGMTPRQLCTAFIEDLPNEVMSQTFRSRIHSRLALGLKHHERAYRATDIVLIEPDHRDATLFFANTFSSRQRRRMAEHACRQTRTMLRGRAPALTAQLARHGIQLNLRAASGERQLLSTPRPVPAARSVARLHATLDRLEHQLRQRPRPLPRPPCAAVHPR